jgi:hypothetical protein
MTIQLFNSFLTMTTFLKLNTEITNNYIFKTPLISNSYIIKHYNYNTNFRNNIEYHNLKCWKSKCILKFYFENLNDENTIFYLDYSINNNIIKIDNLYVNNDFYDNKYRDFFENRKFLLKTDETTLILKSLINFIEKFAKKNNINKIVIDIHNNLERFNYELKNLGFIITEKISLINPFWLEAEKII